MMIIGVLAAVARGAAASALGVNSNPTGKSTLFARLQLLGKSLGDFRHGAGRISYQDLDLLSGHGVAVELHECPDAGLHLLAVVGKWTAHRRDQADLDGQELVVLGPFSVGEKVVPMLRLTLQHSREARATHSLLARGRDLDPMSSQHFHHRLFGGYREDFPVLATPDGEFRIGVGFLRLGREGLEVHMIICPAVLLAVSRA
jgi:hypothetical protein